MADRHWQPLCHLNELTEGRFFEARIGDIDVFAFRDDEGPRAYLNRCPHRGITLNWSPDRFLDSSGQFIQCSTHGALFRPTDGVCIAGPCQGDQLTALPLRVDQQQLWVSLETRTP